jgi:hypothetical protein
MTGSPAERRVGACFPMKGVARATPPETPAADEQQASGLLWPSLSEFVRSGHLPSIHPEKAFSLEVRLSGSRHHDLRVWKRNGCCKSAPTDMASEVASAALSSAPAVASDRRRQRAIAICMIAGPALLLAGNALHPG